MAISLKSLLNETDGSISKKKNLPPLPSLTPDQEKATIDEFKRLQPSDKKIVVALLKSSCAWCEVEFQVHNLSHNHGICDRHFMEMMGTQPTKKSIALDLQKIDPKILHLTERLFATIRDKRKRSTAGV